MEERVPMTTRASPPAAASQARARYGVVLDERGAVDEAATLETREALRQARVLTVLESTNEDEFDGPRRCLELPSALAEKLGVGESSLVEVTSTGCGAALRAWARPGGPGAALKLGPRGLAVLGARPGDTVEVRAVVSEPFKGYLRGSVGLFKPFAETMGLDVNNLSDEDLSALIDHAFERYYVSNGLFGTPASSVEMVDSLKDAGVNDIACLIDFGIPIEKSVLRPRFGGGSFTSPGATMVEVDVPDAVRADAERRGLRFEVVNQWNWHHGAFEGIHIDGAMLRGCGDPRRCSKAEAV